MFIRLRDSGLQHSVKITSHESNPIAPKQFDDSRRADFDLSLCLFSRGIPDGDDQ
jgi:hypothetical protein